MDRNENDVYVPCDPAELAADARSQLERERYAWMAERGRYKQEIEDLKSSAASWCLLAFMLGVVAVALAVLRATGWTL